MKIIIKKYIYKRRQKERLEKKKINKIYILKQKKEVQNLYIKKIYRVKKKLHFTEMKR